MIFAKGTGLSLRKHTEEVLKAVEILEKFYNGPWKLVKIAAKYHDIGKAFPTFQMKLGNEHYPLKVSKNIDRNIPHSFLSLVFIPARELESLSEEEEKLVLTAVAFHHWRDTFVDYILGEGKNNLNFAFEWILKSKNDLLNEIRKEIADVDINIELCRYLSTKGVSILESNVIYPPHVMATLPSYVLEKISLDDELYRKYIFVLGNLKRADRFVSMVENVNYSLRIENIETSYEGNPKEAVLKGLKNKGIKDPWQRKIIEELSSDENIILVAPTGVGKTEFAFMTADRKIIFALPLRSATNMIYERIKGYFGDKNVALLHSCSDIYLFERLYNENPDMEGEILKKQELTEFLSYPFIILTGDQIFPAAYKFPNYEIIYSVLMNSRIIVDEIQAYSPFSSPAIVKLLEDISKLGGRFLLMTATLPNFIKQEIEKRTKVKFLDIYELFPSQNRHIIKVLKGSNKEMAELAIKNFLEGKNVLVIRNTVNSAMEIYRIIKKKVQNTWLLHSRMTYDDRKQVENLLYENSNEGSNLILVSTQVVEASLDIDFDILLTDLAPADSLVQRMGRIYRRRNYNGIEPNVYIYCHFDNNGQYKYTKGVYTESQELLTIAFICCSEELESILKDQRIANDRRKKYLRSIEKRIFKLKDAEFKLNSKDKKEWVETVYDSLIKLNDFYTIKFYKALEILDSGYIAENHPEAQKLFRRISSLEIVPENLIKDLEEEIRSARSRIEIKKILNKYHISVPLGNITDVEKIHLETPVFKKPLEIFKLRGVHYEHGVGLVPNKSHRYSNII